MNVERLSVPAVLKISSLFAAAVAVTICFTAVGCAHRQPNSTELGATAGGVLGAGLGAIIGSQTGDAGAGLALGGLAGAGAGAMFGRSIDRVDAAHTRQQEMIARQQAQIESQRRELNELRQSTESSSGSRFGAAPSYSTSSTSSYGTYARRGGSSDVTYATPEMISNARARLRSPSSKIVAGGSIVSIPRADVSERSPQISEAETIGSLQPLSAELPATQEIPSEAGAYAASEEVSSPLETDAGLIDAQQPSRADSLNEIDIQNSEQNVESTSAAALSSPQDSIAQAPTGEGKDCDRASDELAEARRKEESSERLFHLRRADRLCPDRVDVAIELGRVYNKLGRTEDATFELQRALKLNPEAASAREELAKIGSN